ncbi:Condensin-2 complex subunit like [Actinidia chinensis var. chinensis]|uniref:Condensin-2 complex subunit like n=1 Tax=Actinidia chinensis var. chinensis TaxID=1590841 RepID=A0A2R6Q3R7_ACTCC|nr:Condensin-2 complex subunit like [Actinidia chinensis var. chinensis]
MEKAIDRIVSELETHPSLSNSNSQTPISESTLFALQTLLDNSLTTENPIEIERLYNSLSSNNLSPSSLLRPIASSMDSGPTHLALLASKLYLSLLLCPDAPVFTIFTPMAFLSLLCSIRRSLKNPNPVLSSSEKRARKKKKGSGGVGSSSNWSRKIEGDEEEREERRFDVRDLFPVLERLELVLGLVHLDRFPDSLKSLIQTVGEIPVMAVELCGTTAIYGKLCDLCSRILSKILSPEHGDQAITAAEVLKSLSQAILLLKSQARTFALGFVVNKMMALAKDSGKIKKAVVNLPMYLVHKAPEKSEPRASAVDSIMEIVKALECEDQIGFAEYVVKMTQGKSQLRLLAVDLMPILVTSLRDPLGLNSEIGVENSWGLRCLEALIQRCSDVTAGIRARAMTNLAQLVGFLSGDDSSREVLKEVLKFSNAKRNSAGSRMNDLLRKRCADEKAAVRKAALLLISKLIALLGGAFDEDVLKTMGMACSDPLVSIRKAAVSALSEAFRTFSDDSVTKEWLHSVPRLITDNETSIQEECENLFLELVLDRVSRAGNSNLQNRKSVFYSFEREIELLFPEGVLGLLKEICNGEVAPWVKKICTSLGKKKRLKPKLACALQNIIRTSESVWLSHSMPIEKWMAPPGVWLLLSEVSTFLSKAVDWEFLRHQWELLDKYAPDGEVKSPLELGLADEEIVGIESNSVAWAGDRVCLLQTISNVSVELLPEPAADLAHKLLQRIEEFNMHSTEVNAHVKALRTLCKRKASNPEEADGLVMRWVQQLLSKASQILEMYMSKDSEANKENSFLTPPVSGSKKGKRAAASMSRLLSQAIIAAYTIGSLVIVCPSSDLKAIVPVLHTIITSGSSDPKLNKLLGTAVSIKYTAPSLYIQAWLAMGKVCLADEKLAKRYIPLFVQELEKSDCAALRNNIVVMMADFCIRYTALVDCYISKITKCLRDPCELVRRQTFILLSRLLQRDYVKWRGVLFLRFLLSLVDESEKIRQLADFLFGNILKAKAPLLAYNSFVEAIFVLNDCDPHNGHSRSQSSRAEGRLFSIRRNDEKSRSRRMHIYVSLLKQMAPEHLLATFAKVCAEILASASDGMLNTEDATEQAVLQDAFQILACKEIRIPFSRGPSSDLGDIDDEGGDNGGGAAAAAAAVRGRVITQAVKKGLIQNTIPIFIELKRLLESKNNPLTGSLMECLRILLKDYKNEIDEILVADKQLQKELIYDMQRYELLKAKSTAAQAYHSPAVSKVASERNVRNRVPDKLKSGNSKVASAVADVVATATARSVLREVNRGASTPPLSAMSVPKLKPSNSAVLESLRRIPCFESDEEN